MRLIIFRDIAESFRGLQGTECPCHPKWALLILVHNISDHHLAFAGLNGYNSPTLLDLCKGVDGQRVRVGIQQHTRSCFVPQVSGRATF